MCLWKLSGVITIIICYPEILFLPVKSEILLKPSQELGSSARQTLSVNSSTTGTIVSTTTATGTSNIMIITSTTTTTTTTRSTTSAASLLDDSDEASKGSEKPETTDVPSGDESVETSIILKSSDTQTSNRVYCKGAFFCRYRTIPYTSAKVRVFSNIARVDEKPKVNYIVDGTESWDQGNFELEGENRDFAVPFRPVIAVYHQCGQLKRKNATYRRFLIKIPQEFVSANETFYIGIINLELFFPGQKEGIKFVHFNKPLEIAGGVFCGERYNITAAVIRLFLTNKQEAENFVVEQQPDSSGQFRLSSGRALLQKPILAISHQCGVTDYEFRTGIYRQFVIHIPYFYYNPGRIGLKVYNVGRLSLDIIYPNEHTATLVDITS